MSKNNQLLLNFDGSFSSKSRLASYSWILVDKSTSITYQNSDIIRDSVTSNYAEYFGLLSGIMFIFHNNLYKNKKITINGDSQLVVQQLLGNWKINDQQLLLLNNQIKFFLQQMLNQSQSQIEILHVKRTLNQKADKLAQDTRKLFESLKN